LSPIFLTDFGITNFFKLEHIVKASFPIVISFSGRIISSNAPQKSNKLLLIDSKFSGKTTFFNELQQRNALSPICFTEFGITISERPLEQNANSSIVSIP